MGRWDAFQAAPQGTSPRQPSRGQEPQHRHHLGSGGLPPTEATQVKRTLTVDPESELSLFPNVFFDKKGCIRKLQTMPLTEDGSS